MPAMREMIHPVRIWWLAVVLAATWTFAPKQAAGAWLTPRSYGETVVIDPGHGGRDKGARGPAGLLEKDVTLAMALALQTELAKDYRVLLTRKADYSLPVDERAALANHNRANLFISLHTGAAFSPEPIGISVFYCRRSPETDDSVALQPPAGAASVQGWRQIYLRHRQASRRFARLASDRLTQRLPTPVALQGMPLRVLMGADMPAVLIEIGYLTNPLDEKELQDAAHLAEIAKALHAAINAFFHHP